MSAPSLPHWQWINMVAMLLGREPEEVQIAYDKVLAERAREEALALLEAEVAEGRDDVVLHALHLSCGAAAIGATSLRARKP